ncbi:MAG: entericidin A/B family lipoprotein [Verrucomicrobia bacterium]|nr:entericidin A/B family lipoprotein [Verrucomicrobiota bacterium]MCH8510642.1 entericidin A/B family lipoprotein [Kiritimatiellia bacterium]
MKTIKILLMLLTGLSLLAASACRETMRGAGEDIENAGENIQDSAR